MLHVESWKRADIRYSKIFERERLESAAYGKIVRSRKEKRFGELRKWNYKKSYHFNATFLDILFEEFVLLHIYLIFLFVCNIALRCRYNVAKAVNSNIFIT